MKRTMERGMNGMTQRPNAIAVLVACALAAAALLSGLTGLGVRSASASNFDTHACFSRNAGGRIEACSELLAQPNVPSDTRAAAFAMRALTLSLIGRYADAIADYDKAIEINPNYPVALNNRAWAHFRSGNFSAAWPDVERSLALDPWSPHAYDTRAHLHHVAGRATEAFEDYKRAMRLGGVEMVKLYQCGLQAHGHYLGPMNGIISDSLVLGLKACSADKKCDPLPPDEECKAATS
jgi:tetratricopeptide (TPR) repeat protein